MLSTKVCSRWQDNIPHAMPSLDRPASKRLVSQPLQLQCYLGAACGTGGRLLRILLSLLGLQQHCLHHF